MTLYEAIYGRKPSQIPPYKKDATSVQAVDEWLQDRHALLLLFKTNIREAKERMKQKTDADQHEVNFEVGDNVQREVLRNGRIESQFLVQWSSEPHENSTWVPTENLRKLYPEFHLEDKVTFDGRPSVTPTIAQDIRSQPKSEVVEYQQADQKDDRAKYIRE
nr:Transposon Ty3-G Gag-Pol polyprotein [Ipomoea batatas]